jgi:hypothetical protein
MIVVIQCAAKKKAEAGYLTAADGRPVRFVAEPSTAPGHLAYLYYRPDDPSDRGMTWRQMLLGYNERPESNPRGLLPAWQLYENRIYAQLVKQIGVHNVYILSAGWGLIGAGFLTPQYDITFSASAEPYKRRRRGDRYEDLRMLPDDTEHDVLFFGGKDYLPLFCSLTDTVRGTRTVFYNSKIPPQAPGCRLVLFDTATRTNWHYECAKAFLDGAL